MGDSYGSDHGAENNSSYNSTDTATPFSFILPRGIEGYAPIILVEFIISLISNVILMALILKARKVQNNTNIYLFSVCIAGLFEAFNLFMLLITVTARRWVLGSAMCAINSFILLLTLFTLILLHLCISRDRYKAVSDPFHWQPKTKYSYVYSVVIWAVSLAFSLYAMSSYIDKPPRPDTEESAFSCFGLTIFRDGSQVKALVNAILLVSTFYPLNVIVAVVTLRNYILVLRELHLVKRLRQQACILSSVHVLRVNGRDKPLRCTAEERATKSLAVLCIIQFVCSFLITTITFARLIESILKKTPLGEITHPAELTLWCIVQLMPSINPGILILINSRFRNRVKDIFRYTSELKPEVDMSLKKQRRLKRITPDIFTVAPEHFGLHAAGIPLSLQNNGPSTGVASLFSLNPTNSLQNTRPKVFSAWIENPDH